MNATLARLTRLTADPQPAGDGPLLTAFLAGDQEAFAALVRRHAGLVFATCRRILRHQQDAEDAFQATFLILARRAADVWPREAVASWLFGVAHRVALKARAARNRRLTREQPLPETPGKEEAAPDFDAAELVHRVVCKLPEVYRAAVVACDLEGLSRKEAAERLGWTEGTLSGRLARARELLATRLRRTGLSLPAALAALASGESASAAVTQCTIELATGAAGATPSVLALTEGVVRSMALCKLKAVGTAVLAACAIGWGVLAASGAGPGDQPGTKPAPKAGRANPPAVVAEQPTNPPATPQPTPPKPADLDRLKGTWRVVSIGEGDKAMPVDLNQPVTFEFGGSTLLMPYLEEGKVWKHRAFSFSIDPSKTPREIDLTAKNAPFGRGIYEFTAPAVTCRSCHKAPNEPLVWKFGPKPPENLIGLCGPGMEKAGGLRLAISIDGKRPAKFGGPGVVVFNLARVGGDDDGEAARLRREEEELRAAIKSATDAARKAELETKLRLAQAKQTLLTARESLRRAESEAEVARAQLGLAQAQAERAEKQLQHAKSWLKSAERNVADAGKQPQAVPAKEGEVFTVRVRPLTAAEKVIRVKATGKETVLEALTHAEGVALKPAAVSVWVVRDDAILPVDLAAIRRGDTKTNYALKPGDQLFIQARQNP